MTRGGERRYQGVRSRLVASFALSAVAVLSGFVWPGAVSAAPATVTITDALSPAEVTIAPGETVTWRNSHNTRHRMRSTSGPGDFDTSDIEPGQAVTMRFNAAGTYSYRDERDRENSRYQGRVVVRSGDTGNPTQPPPAAPSAASVSIVDRAFSPASISVAPGGTVTWTNNDDRGHTATADNGAFASPTLSGGGRFSHVFPTPGTFAYFCELHPEMRGVVSVGQGGGGGGGAPVPPPPPGPGPSGPSAPSGPASVSIVDSAFNPQSLEVAVGTTVNWVNNGRARHTATADNGAFDSGNLSAGGRFSHTFTTEGSFSYFCAIHPEMKGVVNVGAAAAGAPPAPPPPDGPTAAAAGDAKVMSATVNMKDYRFDPEHLTVGVGAEVTFKHDGRAPHTATAEDGSFDTGELDNGGTFTHTFGNVGTYEYICALHPRMRGTIEVVADANTKPVGKSGSGVGLEHIAFATIAGAPLLFIGSAMLNGWRSR